MQLVRHMIRLNNDLITRFNVAIFDAILELRIVAVVVCIFLLHTVSKIVIDFWKNKKYFIERKKCFNECLKKLLHIDSKSKQGYSRNSTHRSNDAPFENVVLIQDGRRRSSNDIIFVTDLRSCLPNVYPKLLFRSIHYSSLNSIRNELKSIQKGTRSIIFLEGFTTKLKRIFDDKVFHNLLIHVSKIVGLGSVLVFDYNSVRLEKETFVDTLYANVIVNILYTNVIKKVWSRKSDSKGTNIHHEYLNFFLRDTCWHLRDIIANKNILNVAILEKVDVIPTYQPQHHLYDKQDQIESRALENENTQLKAMIRSLKTEKSYHTHIVQEIHNKFFDISLKMSSTKKENKKLHNENKNLRLKLERSNEKVSLYETGQNKIRKSNLVDSVRSNRENKSNNESKMRFVFKMVGRFVQQSKSMREETKKSKHIIKDMQKPIEQINPVNKERKVIQKNRDVMLHRCQKRNSIGIPNPDKEFLKRSLFLLTITFFLVFNLIYAGSFQFSHWKNWGKLSTNGNSMLLYHIRKECSKIAVPIINAMTTILEPQKFSTKSWKKHEIFDQSSFNTSSSQQLEFTVLNRPDIFQDNTSITSLNDNDSLFRPYQKFALISKPDHGNLTDVLINGNTTKTIISNTSILNHSDSSSMIFDIGVSKTQNQVKTNWNNHISTQPKSSKNKKISKLCSPKHKISYHVQAMQLNICCLRRNNFFSDTNQLFISDSLTETKNTMVQKKNDLKASKKSRILKSTLGLSKKKRTMLQEKGDTKSPKKSRIVNQTDSSSKTEMTHREKRKKIVIVIDYILRPFRALYRMIKSLAQLK